MSNINEVEASVLRDLEKLIGRSPRIKKKEGHIILIDISDNQLKELPESIGTLSNLQELDISNNWLRKLPVSIGTLSNLLVLVIIFSQLKELPESIGNLSNLQELYIGGNQLKELPVSIGTLSNLQKLDIGGNQLKELPEFIGNLSNLQELYISGYQLKELPEFIGTLSNLLVLDINGNQLEELPEFIGNLSSLQKRDISGNQLKELPEYIGTLSNLQTLLIDKNYISTFPESILKMENIKDQIENSFNFLLAFDYFPKKYSVNEGDTKEEVNRNDRSNITVQKHLFSKLANSAMKSYYWNFITQFSKTQFSKFYLDLFRGVHWEFSLYQITSSTDKKQREKIDFKEGENTIHLDHPYRKNNFIELQMVIEFRFPFEKFKYLAPLIRSITITAETDRGD